TGTLFDLFAARPAANGRIVFGIMAACLEEGKQDIGCRLVQSESFTCKKGTPNGPKATWPAETRFARDGNLRGHRRHGRPEVVARFPARAGWLLLQQDDRGLVAAVNRQRPLRRATRWCRRNRGQGVGSLVIPRPVSAQPSPTPAFAGEQGVG